MKRFLILMGLTVGSLVACGEPSTPTERGEPLQIGGSYEVTGVTISATTGTQRPIKGRVNLTVVGDSYTTHFELQTYFPGAASVAAEVVGTGEGSVDGAVLEGTAKLQIVASKVPGVDVGFSMIPAGVGPAVASTSRAEFFADGSVQIRIENAPAEGEEQYDPTTTRLVGYRIEDI